MDQIGLGDRQHLKNLAYTKNQYASHERKNQL